MRCRCGRKELQLVGLTDNELSGGCDLGKARTLERGRRRWPLLLRYLVTVENDAPATQQRHDCVSPSLAAGARNKRVAG